LCYDVETPGFGNMAFIPVVLFSCALLTTPFQENQSQLYQEARISYERYFSACGPRALLLICQQKKVHADFDKLYVQAHTNRYGTTLAGLANAARSVGWNAVGVEMDEQAIRTLKGPAIAWVDGNHYIAVLSVSGSNACIHDPNKLRKETISVGALSKRSHGIFLLLTR